MAYTTANLLEKALAITTAFAGSASSSSVPLDSVLRTVFEELKKINQEID